MVHGCKCGCARRRGELERLLHKHSPWSAFSGEECWTRQTSINQLRCPCTRAHSRTQIRTGANKARHSEALTPVIVALLFCRGDKMGNGLLTWTASGHTVALSRQHTDIQSRESKNRRTKQQETNPQGMLSFSHDATVKDSPTMCFNRQDILTQKLSLASILAQNVVPPNL